MKKDNKDKLETLNDNSVLLSQFAKNIKASAIKTNNCIIYTRVSTKEQEQGYSLDAQKKDCIEFARKNNYNVLGFFGGTYESAKTDERKEFNKMLQFAKRSKEKITYIVVHMVDRFSRSGANAIYLKEQLKDVGIYIQSVRQPVDSSTSSGDFQQNIQMIFSHYDNQLRREKCMSGTKEALEKGDWVAKPPMGFDIVYSQGVKRIVLNERGKLIRKAFHWKAEGYKTEEIIQKLKPLGFEPYPQFLSRVFRNPFYCGKISHTALEGKLANGNHEKCVSEEIFLKANEVLKKNPQGYHHSVDAEFIPLKNFVKCDHCGTNMPGYVVKKKKLWYYKCRTPKCSNNKSAKSLHDLYRKLIDLLTVKEEYKDRLRKVLVNKINQLQTEKQDEKQGLVSKMKEIENKLERLKERFAYEEIDKEIYSQFSGKLKVELNEVHLKMQTSMNKVSNPENLADKIVNYSQNLREVWDDSNYEKKAKLQYMVFPKGIRYNKKNDECRTSEMDPVFGWIAQQQGEMEVNEKGNSPIFMKNSPLVARSGFEPETSGL